MAYDSAPFEAAYHFRAVGSVAVAEVAVGVGDFGSLLYWVRMFDQTEESGIVVNFEGQSMEDAAMGVLEFYDPRGFRRKPILEVVNRASVRP